MAVFTGRRIYDNNVQGTLTDNPLTNVATTMNSAGLANLSAVSSNHAVIVLDPLRASGAPEIVIVTAHTGSATSATITRGAYGTSARQHASGTLWVHPFVDADISEILTADPTDFYEGQRWVRSDTDRFMSHDGTNIQRVGWYSPTGRTGCTVLRVATQAIADAADAVITWDTESYDSDGFITVPSTTITIPAGLGGLYSITTNGQLPTDPSTASYEYLTIGGTLYLRNHAPTIGGRWFNSNVIAPIAAGATITYTVYQDHSAGQNFSAGILHLYRIGP